MKKSLIFGLVLLLSGVVLAQSVERAEWVLKKSSDNTPQQREFLATGSYPATFGSATLSFVSGKKVVKASIEEKGALSAESKKGDYWLFEMPVKADKEGVVVDFWTQINSEPEKERHRFAIEYRDGKKWLPLMPLDSDGANYTTTANNKFQLTAWGAARFTKLSKDGKVAFRVRQVENKPLKVSVQNPSGRGRLNQMVRYDGVEVRDTTSYLFIGNSYTFYYTYPMIFKEIAWSEGHYALCDIFISGGYTMKAHLANKYSREVVDRGGYEYAFLQDQSILPTLMGTPDDTGTVEYMREMVGNVRKASPAVKPIIEITWGRKHGNNAFGKKYEHLIAKYPHFYANYEAMQARIIEVTTEEAKMLGVDLSPVGVAWRIVRRERPDIELYWKDAHHQSYAGSYLAAAVAYQVVYRTPFSERAANAKLDAETAAYLRSVAERVVLNNEK